MAKKRKGRWTIARRVVQIVVAILFLRADFRGGLECFGAGLFSPEEPLATPSGFAWWGSLVVAFVRLDLLDPFAALQRLRRRRKTLLLPVLLGRFLFWWLTAWFAGALFAAGRVR